MPTNMTLSLTVRDEAQQKLAGNILTDAFDRLIEGVPGLLSINLSVFDDDFLPEEKTEPAAEVGRQIRIREGNPDGVAFEHSVDVEPRP